MWSGCMREMAKGYIRTLPGIYEVKMQENEIHRKVIEPPDFFS